MKLKQKLIIVTVLLITIPLFISGYVSFSKASSSLEESYLEATTTLTEEVAESIHNEFSGYLYGIEAIADNYSAKTIMDTPANETELMNVIENYVVKYPNAFQAYIGVEDSTMRLHPHLDLPSSYDPRTRAWYTLVKETGESGWTQMYTDAGNGNWAISATAPVYDNNGEFIGAVATSLDLSEVSSKLAEKVIGKKGYVFVLEKSGRVVTHKNPDNIGTIVPVKEIQDEIAGDSPAGYIDYVYTDPEGNVYNKFATYKYIPEMGWYVMATIDYAEITEITNDLLVQNVMVILVSLVVAVIITIIASNSIIKPIQSLVASMGQVAAGDMTIQSQISRKDELGILAKSFNKMIANIRSLVESASMVTSEVSDTSQNLAGSAEEVSASSDQVTKTIEEIANGATNQATDSQNAVILAENLDAKFVDLTKSSAGIADSALSVQENNQKGLDVLNELKVKSTENNESTERIANAINDLEQKSKDISSIVESITSIADQTNLLALNASIEAARAGEHGRGFAVVAEEIRKLAEESGNSAEQIAKIVLMIQEQTGATVEIMDEFKENSEGQYKAVDQMDKSFNEISSSVNVVGEQITEIDNYIATMTNDKDAIVDAINNISSVSEETAAISQEVSATMEQQNSAIETVAFSAEKLNGLTIKLNEEIRKFKIK